jgi:uncharacterized membrane protein
MDINKTFILNYIKYLVVYIVVDMIWIFGAKRLHNTTVQDVQGSKLVVDPVAAGLYYLIAPLSYIYIIKPLSKTRKDLIKNSMMVGLLMYGTFDLTNKAIFKNYSWTYTLSDMAWGMFSMTLTSLIVT